MIKTENEDITITLSDQDWDSGIFKFRCGYLDIAKTSDTSNPSCYILNRYLKELIDTAKEQSYKLLTAKIDASEMNIVNSCFENGGTLIDTEITFRKSRVDNFNEINLPDNFSIKVLEKFWDDSLFDLANTIPRSRFFKDENIGIDNALKLWRTSIFNNCNGRASYSVFCFERDKPIGLMNIFEKGDTSDISFIALIPAYQNMGLGTAMINYYEKQLDGTIRQETVETQLTNYTAQSLYGRRGFKNARSKHIIHFWLC